MSRVNGKIYYNNATGDVLIYIPQNEGPWVSEKTLQQDIASFPVLQSVSTSVISVIRLAWDQYKADFAVSRPVKVVDGKLTWVPLDAPETPAEDKPFSERVAELEKENRLLKLQNEAHTTNYQFIEDVVTELILTTMP